MVKIFKASRQKKVKATSVLKDMTVHIDAQDHAGNGLSLSSKPILIVDNAIAGETCKVNITKSSKRVQFGEAIHIVEASSKRINAFCEYYAKCGGCTLQHLSAQDGLAIKESAFKSFVAKQLNMDVSNSNIWHAPILSNIAYQAASGAESRHSRSYRRRIRLAVDARNTKDIKLGFRSKSSSEVVNIAFCAIASKPINDCLAALSTQIQSLPNIKHLGHVVMTEGYFHTEIAFFVTQALSKKSQAWYKQLAQITKASIVVKHNSQSLLRLDSNGEVVQEILQIQDDESAQLNIDSDQFLQVNQHVNKKMLQQAKDWLRPTKEDVVFDLFCGAGNFSLFMAGQSQSVFGFEGLASLVESATRNAGSLSINNCEFKQGDLSNQEVLNSLKIPDNALLILDPSREGAQQLCEYLISINVLRLVYISCNPNSFVRDANILDARYKLEKISVLDMFPFTKHLEVMALFSAK